MPPDLVDQMLERIGHNDTLPERWQEKGTAMKRSPSYSPPDEDDEKYTLQQWLHEAYHFDEKRKRELTEDDLASVGAMIGRLMRFEPSARASPQEILEDPWFKAS